MNMLRMISFLGFLMLIFVLVAPSALAVNKVLSLDGDGDKVDVLNPINLPLEATARTMSARVMLPPEQFDCGILAYGTLDYYKACGIWVNREGFFDNFLWGNDLHSLAKITDNLWHHCAMTYDGTTRILYVDGNLVASDTPPEVSTEYGKIRIGHIEDDARFIAGFIDEVRLWNIARTQDEIQDAMNRTLTLDEIQSENLVGYWNFDSGDARDLSQYENHGELYGDAYIADVIYVSTEGDDLTGDGTKDNPYRTLQKGIDETRRGDIVQVLPGIYEENIKLYSDLSVFGSGVENTTITAASGNIVTANNVYNVSLSGFTIDGQGSAENGIRCSGSTSEMEISSNIITETSVVGIRCLDSVNVDIKKNTIRRNVQDGVECGNFANVTIDGNNFDDNERYGILCQGNVIITNNYIHDHCNWSIFCVHSSNVKIQYNIISKNGRGIVCTDSSTLNIVSNTIQSNLGVGILCDYITGDWIVKINNNLIHSNQGPGIVVRDSANATIIRNVIRANRDGAISCQGSSLALIGGNLPDANNIIENGIHNDTPNEINATFNYWGTTDESEIAAMINNTGTGSVKFKPFVTEYDKIVADTSGDGTISAYDAALILQYVVGLIDEFPATSPIGQAAQKYVAGEITIEELDRILQKWGYSSVFKLLGFENQLLQNYPNPFNPETWIPFKLAQDIPVTISIYDTKGQLIRTIALGNRTAGIYTTKAKAAYWDGRDSLGDKVSSGVYFYTLQAGGFRVTRKMVIMK